MHIRVSRSEDLAPLTALYNHYIETTVATFDLEPFTLDQREELWFRHYASTGRYRLLVAEEDGVILGYATSSPFRAKAAYDTSVETSIYLAPTATGHGVGRALYAALFDSLAGEDLHRAYALISLPNDASVALHEKFGFTLAGTMQEIGRKFDRFWDVAFYEKAL